MRIMGFSKHWGKLNQNVFTTCRFQRKDKDWFVGETVQIVFKPRSKEREILSCAEIIKKEPRTFIRGAVDAFIDAEVREDGFYSFDLMKGWFIITYGGHLYDRPINKLTLRKL